MLDHINTNSDDDKYELIYGSFKLFLEVDINGDGQMEWSEFMQYIIDAVSASAIRGNEESETVQEQIARIKAQKYNRFGSAPTPVDKTSHSNVIKEAILCGKCENILLFERYRRHIKLYDYKMNLVKKMEVPLKKEGFVNSVTYDEENKLYVCTATDGYIHIFQKSKIKIDFLKSTETPCIQTGIWYMPRQKLWLTGGKDNKLR
jgi:hypothetical protein